MYYEIWENGAPFKPEGYSRTYGSVEEAEETLKYHIDNEFPINVYDHEYEIVEVKVIKSWIAKAIVTLVEK